MRTNSANKGNTMRICIHRGSREIGGSCVELENNGQRLLLDLGVPLDAQTNTSDLLPNIDGLDGSDPHLLGILVSHPHQDHFGLLEHVSPNIPLAMGPAAERILNAAAPFMRTKWSPPPVRWHYESGNSFEIGTFTITPFLVDHSAYDSYALKIDAGGKCIFYTGDFRAHGRKGSLFQHMLQNPPKQVDALLLEGSTIGRISPGQLFSLESEIERHMADFFRETTGLTMVHTSSQNIDRVVTVMRAAKRTGRTLLIDLYSAAILEATENPNIPQSHWQDVSLFIPFAQRIQIKKLELFDLLKNHSKNRIYPEDIAAEPSKYVLLFRPLHMHDLESADCLSGASFIYSQWEGYWNQGNFKDVGKWMKKHAIPKHNLHTSGHASPVDLKKLADAIDPKTVIPIHTFEPDQYQSLFKNVTQLNDGEWRDA